MVTGNARPTTPGSTPRCCGRHCVEQVPRTIRAASPRSLAEAEGSFLLCGFLVALTHQLLGERVAARRWYETTRAAAGPPQLYSEEFDAVQHQMRGNLPQAFVHALHIETAIRLAD
jgi:GH15 family glucan-1,4-alpha-glucosidase